MKKTAFLLVVGLPAVLFVMVLCRAEAIQTQHKIVSSNPAPRGISTTQYEAIIACEDSSLPINDHAADLISRMTVVEFISGLKYIRDDFSFLRMNLDHSKGVIYEF